MAIQFRASIELAIWISKNSRNAYLGDVVGQRASIVMITQKGFQSSPSPARARFDQEKDLRHQDL